MKKLALLTISLLISMVTFTQMVDVPQKICYSGVVRKKIGYNKYELVKNTDVNFKVVIKHSNTVVFSEDHKGVKVNGKGQVIFDIGKGDNQTRQFKTLEWHTFYNPVIEVDIIGDKCLAVYGRIIIRTVPYAFYSRVSRYFTNANGDLFEIGPDGTVVPKDGSPVTPPVIPVVEEIDPDLPGGPQTKDGNLDSTHPFVRLARFNVKQDGSFMGTHENHKDNGFFTFDEANKLKLPAGYDLPSRTDFKAFMPNIKYTVGKSVYETIGEVHFRYTYKKFIAQKGGYLEILAVKATTAEAAKLKLDNNDGDVAARYFPAAGFKNRNSVSVLDVGIRGDYWSSTNEDVLNAWRFNFCPKESYVTYLSRTDLFNVRLINKP